MLEFDLELQLLEPIVRQAIEANQEYAGRLGVRVELTHIAGDVTVRVDRDRLTQVLTNLISNAAKFSPQGAMVSLGIRKDGRSVRVSVQDRGQGIAEAFRSRIFHQFAQADSSDSRNKGGTGLGLSIARAFMERLDGGIDYETVAGEGTTFFITLPLYATSS
jgi:signal transduction histidine kinase